ncbi:MAG TPA: DUF2059 domain-containing protein [Pseudomonadales bacterium]
MTTALIRSTLLLFTLFCLPALAASPVSQLMALSGLNDQIDSIPAGIQAGIAQSGDMEDPDMQALSDTMMTIFSAERLKQQTAQYLATTLDKADIEQVLDWLNSPLGRRITRLEVDSSAPESMADMQAMLPVLMQDSQRLALMADLDRATMASEATVSMMLSIQKAMLSGMMSNAPADEQMSEADIDQLLANLRPQIEAQYREFVTASMLYTYRVLEEDDIRRYIAFADSAAGRHYHSAAIGAISQAMSEASQALGKLLAERFGDH